MRTTENAILLTGASSGIGYALLKRLHGLGNKLLVTSRSDESLQKLSKEFSDLQTFRCDLSNATAVQLLIDYCQKNFSDLNVLINNAGVQYEYQVQEEQGRARLEDEIRTNFISPLMLIQELLPLLAKQQPAAIVNITSALAIAPKQSAPVYCGTKAGLQNYGKALRYQLRNTNIKLIEVIPPLVDTAMTEGRGSGKLSPEKLVDEFLRGFAKDKETIYIGKARLLRLVHRLAPGIADNILKDS